MRRFVVLACAGVSLAALSLAVMTGPVAAQYDNRALFDRIERLERDLQATQRQISRDGVSTTVTSPALGGGVRTSGDRPAPPSKDTVERLNDRVDQLEKTVQDLTGRLEEANFKAEQAMQKVQQLQNDVDLRFNDLQQGGGVSSSGGLAGMAGMAGMSGMSGMDGGLAAPADDSGIADIADPKAQYDAAYAAAQRGDFAAAEQGFQTFLKKNPKHALASNAEYWLADIAYTRKDYQAAAAGFAEAYKKYPKSDKAPDMLYKLGASFGQMGKKAEACKAFDILFDKHSNMPDRVKRAATSEKKRYACK